MALFNKKLILLIVAGGLVSSCYKVVTVIPGMGLDDWTSSTHNATSGNYDVVFDQSVVNRLDLVISADNWEIMQDDLDDLYGSSSGMGPDQQFADENPVYVPCDVFFNDTQWYYVGVRYKGNSSLSSSYTQGIGKMPFRLEFDHFDHDYPEIASQNFYGFSQLSLSNNFDDPSLMREKVATDLFREFGVPAPNSAYYELYVDFGEGPVYFGLYTFLEVVFDQMLITQFGSESGNCYKPDGDAASFANGSFSTADFGKKTNENSADWSDVEALYEVLNDDSRVSNPSSWRTELESILDVDGFLKWLAVNTTIQNWDTYGRMTHNYYLYNDPADGLLKWIPWDNNEAFQEGKMGGAISFETSEIGEDWPLIHHLLEQDEYRSIYDDYISEFITSAFEPSKMAGQYNDNFNLIQDYVIGSNAEISGYSFLNSASEFTQALNELTSHVSERNSLAYSYLN